MEDKKLTEEQEAELIISRLTHTPSELRLLEIKSLVNKLFEMVQNKHDTKT